MVNRKNLYIHLIFVLVTIFLYRSFFDVKFTSAQAETVKTHFTLSSNHVLASKNKFENQLYKNETHTHTQISSPIITNNFNKEDIYCKLKNLNLGVPIEGDVKIIINIYDKDEYGESGAIVWIYSNECPSGHYSKVQLNSGGNLVKLNDCRQATMEELAIYSGMQGEIRDALIEPNHLNLAISGPGFFIEDCEGSLNYIRNGQFIVAMDGTVMSKSGCTIQGEDGTSLSVGHTDELDEQGCNANGQCIAIANPGIKDVVYSGKEKFLAISSPGAFFLQKKFLFKNAYEDLSNPEFGPFGPDFSKLPILKPEQECLN